jgi:hypothetical protein
MQDHPQENLSTGTAEKPGFPAAYVTFIPFPSQTARDRVPRILIVEDEVFIALMIEEMVREIGYEVSGTVHNIAMARQEFAKKNFDAVLLDISVGGRRDPETADFLLKAGVSRSHSYPRKFAACWKRWSGLHRQAAKSLRRRLGPKAATADQPFTSSQRNFRFARESGHFSRAFGIIATPPHTAVMGSRLPLTQT